MCLNTIKETYKGRGKTVIAYKEFRKDTGGQIINRFRPTHSPWIIKREKSAGAKGKIKNPCKGFVYAAGFHAYTKCPKLHSPDSASGGVYVAKVRLRGVHTLGTQGSRRVYVGRYCTILEILG